MTINRRKFLKTAIASSGAFIAPHIFTRASAQKTIRLGFIALTDSASLIMAKELGLYKKYGLEVEIVKQASWAALRDGVLNGDIQGAHCLFGMPFSVYTGIGGQAGKEMKIALVLSNNGQAITLAKSLISVGRDPKKLKAALEKLAADGKDTTFAMTFPGGTHDLWLRNYLAAAGIDATVSGKQRIITIPPPQMVANMKVGNMIGYSVGEPWNGVGVQQDVGFTAITSQEIWRHHPEKALVLNNEFSEQTDTVKKLMKATLEAAQWLDNIPNIRKAATTIGQSQYVNANPDVIGARLEGRYDLGGGLGTKQYLEDRMQFYRSGKTPYPRLSHAIWFMSQYVRFGYLKSAPDYKAIANKLIMQDLYEDVAKEMNIPLPKDDMKPFALEIDKQKFDPANPAAYLKAVM
ncbi:MAG: ABC transporter substrate-binding protein [Pleurocapsa sp. SU_196_0]|nr:ABC transporter substrate-binding protein [Pleurocapsa sp. SU_196_0]